MPVKLAPPAKPKAPARIVHLAGKQEDFADLGAALTAQLGWDGPDDHLGNDIAVADARGFLIKTLHEHFQAGAKGESQPDVKVVFEHLALTDEADVAMIEAECSKAFDAGKGATLSSVEGVDANFGANLVLTENFMQKAIAAGKGV